MEVKIIEKLADIEKLLDAIEKRLDTQSVEGFFENQQNIEKNETEVDIKVQTNDDGTWISSMFWLLGYKK